MAKKKVYILVGVEIENENVENITIDMINDIFINANCQIDNVEDFSLKTEIDDVFHYYPF